MSGRLIRDTSEIFSIEYGDIIEIADKRYTVMGHEYERRFGMEEPKFWIRRAVDQETGEKKIIKLPFPESFETYFGKAKVKYVRNPHKEAQILEIVKYNPSFINGIVRRDQGGNVIRILDLVPGPNFLVYIDSLNMDFETYYCTALPDILKKLVAAFEAIHFLHKYGLKHGDIRNDHIIVVRHSGNYVWIDFDYDYEIDDNPFAIEILELGNILINAIGKGFHTIQKIMNDPMTYGGLKDRLEPGDFSFMHKRRFINLKKHYPFIPNPLNNMLMRFSTKADSYYGSVEELIEDMNKCLLCIS